ncbi:MAG: NAD-dependent epimerase/dehydratase family protein [Candidatus Omnitrophota bacterium]
MKILVTGGAGMVGSHAAEYFARKKWKVVVLDNLMRSKLFKSKKQSVEYNWKYLARFRNIERIKGDVRNARDVRRSIGKGVDAILHAAAQPGVGFSIENPVEDFSINLQGTLNVLEWTRRLSPKAAFIFCSTNKVYGENVDRIPLVKEKTRYRFQGKKGISETYPVDLAGHTPYGVSKIAADFYVQEYRHLYGMKTGVFRMSCIYGTRQFGFEDQGWVAHFTIQALLRRPVTLYGDGKQVRDVLYVSDLIRAYEKFIERGNASAVWNIGGGPEYTTSLLEFIHLLERKLGGSMRVRFSDWRPSDQKVYVSDIAKVKKDLRWEPTVPFEEGVEKLLTWVQENKRLFG